MTKVRFRSRWRYLFVSILLLSTYLSPVLSSTARADEIRPIRFPIDARARFANDFGAPRSGGRTHQGNDLFAGKLDVAVSAVDGKITTARLDSSGNAGNMIVIRDSQGWEYWYLHMNNDSPGTDDGSNQTIWAMIPGLRQGSRVVAGQPIAFVGDSGNAEGTAPHVHFEIHAPDGGVINPFDSLQNASREPFPNNHPGAASPFGSIDFVERVPGGIRISGWSIDPDTTGPVTVMAYSNGYWGGEAKANRERGDLASGFPGMGTKHGFSMVVPVGASGRYSTCVYAANAEAGNAGLLGCPALSVNVNPFGAIDQIDRQPGGVNVSGWIIDPDSAESTDVHFYVDGTFVGASSGSIERPDIDGAFPPYGGKHGYGLSLPMSDGFHVLCAYGINLGAGDNSLIGCRWVMNTSDPWSNLDVAERQGGLIRVAGWAIDPNTRSATSVHLYVNGYLAATVAADIARTDLASGFPRYGESHGFTIDTPAATTPQTVCAYAVNQGPGSNTLIGCRNV